MNAHTLQTQLEAARHMARMCEPSAISYWLAQAKRIAIQLQKTKG